MSEIIGTFRGTVTRQSKGKYGAARSVFAKFKGIKNELVYPFNGGRIMNPPKGTGFKMFTGDLMEFRTNERYAQPEVYLLKTYLVESVAGSVVNIVKDGFKHKPFVGDKIGVAPEEIGGEMTAATITAVAVTKVGEQDVWACTLDSALTAEKGDVLVEADEEDKMLVKQINAFADCDMDLVFDATEGDDEFEKAKYDYTPAVGGVYIYIHKMSPLPECVLKVNVSQFNGLFRVDGLVAPAGVVAEVAALNAEIALLNQNGATAPTTSTKGVVGSTYTVTALGSEALYVCTAVSSDATPTYTWIKIFPSA